MTKQPEILPQQFQEDYFKNCDERLAYGETPYTKEEYWVIWSQFNNYKSMKN
jgi:hypothetical protein